jgi:carbamoyltransferase
MKENKANNLGYWNMDTNVAYKITDKKVTLGFSVGHDKGAVLIINGKVMVGISEERLSRLKHDKAFDHNLPLTSIQYCLDYVNLTYDDVDLYVWNTAEKGEDVEDQIKFDFQFYTAQSLDKLKFVNHHLAHAYSTFFSSGLSEAAVVVGDANGNIINPKNSAYEDFAKNHPKYADKKPSNNTYWAEGTTIYHFNLNEYTELEKSFIVDPPPNRDWKGEPYSFNMGHMYAYATMKLVYKYNEKDPNNNWPAAGAGKLMGLASFGNKKWLETQPYLSTYDDIEHTFNINLVDIYTAYPSITVDSSFADKANVAAVFQREQERMALTLAKRAKKLSGSKNICFAGGSFLNCNANEIIIKSGEFENCYFIPPADDSGIPLGCAWYGYQLITKIENNNFLSPYLGKTYTKKEIFRDLQTALRTVPGVKESTTWFNYAEDEDNLIQHLVSLLNDNKVIGMHQGGSEIGPRALGNRSIIASPIYSWMQNYINHNIKNREWYRPFAPSVLNERVHEIFDIDVFSPYMLVTCNVKERWRNKIPAIVHIDNTARIQGVKSDVNPFYHKLISEFDRWTGIPVILNTSFNGAHEPIVETPLDAINTFWSCNLDAVCIGHILIVRNV